jgi:hypothetical protein
MLASPSLIHTQNGHCHEAARAIAIRHYSLVYLALTSSGKTLMHLELLQQKFGLAMSYRCLLPDWLEVR